jgi:hypothetical protein
MTFVHLSDAQLKEERVALSGPLDISVYDGISGGSRRNPELERYDFAVFLATLLGINSVNDAGGSNNPAAYGKCPKPLAPSFVIHTGDSMDAGMFSELFEFLTIVLELEVPFYNAVGNHYNLFFGTFPKQAMKGFDVTIPFVPVGDTDRFLEAHHPDASMFDLSIPYRPSISHEPTVEPRNCQPPKEGEAPQPCWGSDYFGFDLYCPIPRQLRSGRERAMDKVRSKRMASPSFPRHEGSLCPDARGYYGQDFVLPSKPGAPKRKVRLVVLNTAEMTPKTTEEALEQQSKGAMRDEQYLWLTHELESHRDGQTLFIVAGHHTLSRFIGTQENRLRDILLAEPRVGLYLSGHTHVNAMHSYARKNGPALREVTAGSTLVYPQLGNFVDVLERRSTGELYARIRSFRQRISDVWCSSDCDLKYLAARGRRGAFNDNVDGDWRTEQVAKTNANALFPISGFH